MTVHQDATTHTLAVQLLRQSDGSLSGSGEDSLELLWGKLTRIKRRQRDQRPARENVQTWGWKRSTPSRRGFRLPDAWMDLTKPPTR